MSGLYRRSLDGHAPTEPAQTHGRSCESSILVPLGPIGSWIDLQERKTSHNSQAAIHTMKSKRDMPTSDFAEDRASDVRLHELFEWQAVRNPDSVALVYEDISVCYQELNSRANQLARHIRSAGVGEGVMTGLYLDRSLEMVIG